jgi:hypothetical protein
VSARRRAVKSRAATRVPITVAMTLPAFPPENFDSPPARGFIFAGDPSTRRRRLTVPLTRTNERPRQCGRWSRHPPRAHSPEVTPALDPEGRRGLLLAPGGDEDDRVSHGLRSSRRVLAPPREVVAPAPSARRAPRQALTAPSIRRSIERSTASDALEQTGALRPELWKG